MRSLSSVIGFFFLTACSGGFHYSGYGDPSSEVLKKSPERLSALQVRVKDISKIYLGFPYTADPMGEGETGLYDQDPLFCVDRFDCVTYIESVLASTLGSDESSVQEALNQIRYQGGVVSFVTRNHFPSLDWIPSNIKAGFVEEMTFEVAGEEEVFIANALIDKRSWYEKKTLQNIKRSDLSDEEKEALLSNLRREGERFEPTIATLPYIHLDSIFQIPKYRLDEYQKQKEKIEQNTEIELAEENLTEEQRKLIIASKDRSLLSLRLIFSEVNHALLDRIPTGAILSFVRPNWDLTQAIGTHLNVSHQGFAIRDKGELYLRHASSQEKKVVDILLTEYLQKYLLSPTLRGIHVLKVLDN